MARNRIPVSALTTVSDMLLIVCLGIVAIVTAMVMIIIRVRRADGHHGYSQEWRTPK